MNDFPITAAFAITTLKYIAIRECSIVSYCSHYPSRISKAIIATKTFSKHKYPRHKNAKCNQRQTLKGGEGN